MIRLLCKLFALLKSRTVWMIILMFTIGGFAGIREFLSEPLFLLISGILGALAIFFRAKPRAHFE